MPNWCTNTILISGPSEDVSLLYKSLEEYDAEVEAKEKEPDWNSVNIGAWIKAKFSDKLPTFTEEDYALSYRNFIEDYSYSEEDADDKEANLNIYTYSAWDDLRMYALVKLIVVGFPMCIVDYTHRKSDESRYYEWYYSNRFKSDFCMSDEDMYRTLINDYADIIKDNNIVIPTLTDPGVSQIHELVDLLIDYDESLCVYQYRKCRGLICQIGVQIQY